MSSFDRADGRQAAYCRVRDEFRELTGRFSKKRILAVIHNIAQVDKEWMRGRELPSPPVASQPAKEED